MAEDHGAQKPGNSPGSGPEVVERQGVAKERAAQRSWTVPNQMRGVLGRVSTGAAGRILDPLASFAHFSMASPTLSVCFCD